MITIDSSWICSTDAHLSIVSSTIDTLQCNMNVLQSKVDMLFDIIEASNDSVSNQLSAAGIWLEIIAIIIAVAGVFLGFYITKKKNQVEQLAKTVENLAQIIDDKKKVVDKVATDTKTLDEKIRNNVSSLYAELRKAETAALLDRLVLVPDDITNLLDLLLARDLEESDFLKLREAFQNLVNGEDNKDEEEIGSDGAILLGDSYESQYLLLFFQHFCYQAMMDSEIEPKLVAEFGEKCKQAFRRDIIKSTKDFCMALNVEEVSFNKEEVLTAYLKALNASRHKRLSKLKDIFEKKIADQELLENAKERCKEDGVILDMFGIAKSMENATESH